MKIFGMEISGHDNFMLKLAIADENIRKSLEKAMYRAGVQVQKRAQEILEENGHVVTGNLKRSINTKATVKPPAYLEVEIGTWVGYGPYIEALPDGGYLYPAFIENYDQLMKDLQMAVTDAIEKAEKKQKSD